MPPRFARVVENAFGITGDVSVDHMNAHQCRGGVIGYMTPCGICGSGTNTVSPDEVAKLLQREHAAVVRKVKAMYPAPDDAEVFEHGYRQACTDLLAWLDERGR